MKKYFIPFLLFIIISQNACTFIPSSISNESFNFQDITHLSIISSNCSIVKNQSLGLPLEDIELEKETIYSFNKQLINYSKYIDIEILQIPDSNIQKKDRYILNDDIQQIVKNLDDRSLAKNNMENINLKSNLSKYIGTHESKYLVFWYIGGSYSSIAANALNMASGVHKNPSSMTLLFGIIDAETNELLWYCRKHSTLDPRHKSSIECLLKSLFFDLKYNIDILPESFNINLEKDNPVQVFMNNNDVVYGNIIKMEYFKIILKDESGKIKSIDLKDVKTIRNIGDSIIFPRRLPPQIIF